MKIVLPDENKMIEQINSFNLKYSTNCSLQNTDNTVFPILNDGVINYNQNAVTALLLYSLLIDNGELILLSSIYNVLINDIANRRYYEFTKDLIGLLSEEFNEVKGKIKENNETIYLDILVGALISHELCHQKLIIDEHYQKDEFKRILSFIESIEAKGIKALLFRHYANELKNDKSKILEFICDIEAAKYIIAEYKNKTDYDIDQIAKQICNLFHAMNFINYIDEIKLHFSINDRIGRTVFANYRPFLFTKALKEENIDDISDDLINYMNEGNKVVIKYIDQIIRREDTSLLMRIRMSKEKRLSVINERIVNDISLLFNEASRQILDGFS